MSDKEYRKDYNARTYQAYTLRLRKDKHEDLIRYIESRGDSPQRVIYGILIRSMKAYDRRMKKHENKRSE